MSDLDDGKPVADYAKGEWIVHPAYGVGQVEKKEVKRVDGEEIEFYRVEGDQTTYWLHANQPSESNVRRLSSSKEFRKALKVLKQAPKEMDQNFRERRRVISEVIAMGSLGSLVRLIRDLWGRKRAKRLSDTEHIALQRSMDRLTAEWAIAESISPEDAQAELMNILSEQEGEVE